ncbi:site-specific integrase [Solibacillus isronensis]|uniref:site-specific integrase n=1 Tax=Solibacillus isronensis TaxID=412383 RepID=UPI0009A79163|nr:site-specific integrase [Solibacillus isronensis]
MTPRTYRISNDYIPQFTKAIQNLLKDEQFKSLFLDFFKCKLTKMHFLESERYQIHKHFEDYIITLFSDCTIRLISWEQYCLGMKCIRQQNWNEQDKTEISASRKMARRLLLDLYLYVLENTDINTEGIAELKEHKAFLIWQERNSSKMNYVLSNHYLDRLGTNFPIGSSLSELHLFQGDEKTLPLILNLNVRNQEMKKLLLDFYLSENSKRQHNGLRLFVYLFKYSLLAVESSPECITDFTFDVFKKQYRFYQKANILNTTESVQFKLSLQLIRFYSFLCKKIKELNVQHNIFEGTLYNEHFFSGNYFTLFYENGFKAMKYNPFEDVPKENKWLIIGNSDNYASAVKNNNRGIDFTQVQDKSLRADFKNYLWKQSTMSVNSAVSGVYMVIEFLNFISNYKKVNGLQDGNYVNANLLDEWNFHLSWKEPATRNNYIKRTKAYLKFYKEEYRIPQILIDTLSQTPKDDDGGIPMSKKDFELFTQKFQEESRKNLIGKLSYIIYNLAATTKLRPGEIVTLERDCIIEKYDQTGVIQYYSKTSGREKVKATLAIEKINLIEKAILLTEDAHRKAYDDMDKYIFVKRDGSRKDRIVKITFQFTNLFAKFQKELEGQLDNVYRPYSLRTTFIDNLYTEGIQDGLPSSVIAEMAGNGVKTAIKYYRKITTAQDYAEMFAGVTISGVDVYGNITDEKDVESLNPVEKELGGCKSDGCVFDDEEYKCLMCPYFATTPSKIPLFKTQIARLKIIKENTLNATERNIIDAELKLYTAYYAKLLEQIGDD